MNTYDIELQWQVRDCKDGWAILDLVGRNKHLKEPICFATITFCPNFFALTKKNRNELFKFAMSDLIHGYEKHDGE